MAQNYEKIFNNPEIIKWAKTHLKKRNRIEWYLKKVKENISVHPQDTLAHFYAMNIESINNFELKDSITFDDLYLEFHCREKQFLKEAKDTKKGILVSGEEEIVLSLDNNFYWVNLNKSFCEEEASYLGHCGNRGGLTRDTILSLRQKVHKGGRNFWEPHLTFVLNKTTGMLGEMKGKQNTKPHEKYHPQILALLGIPIIKGIGSGGYLPENNFHFSDFINEKVEFLLEYYPEKVSPNQSIFLRNRYNLKLLRDYVFEKEDWGNVLWWVNSENDLFELAVSARSISISIAAAKKITNFSLIKRFLEKKFEEDVYNFSTIIGGGRGENFYTWICAGKDFSEEQLLELYSFAASKGASNFCKSIEHSQKIITKSGNQKALEICANHFPLSVGSSFFFRKLIVDCVDPVYFQLDLTRKYPKTKHYFYSKLTNLYHIEHFSKTINMMNDLELKELLPYIESGETTLIVLNSLLNVDFKKTVLQNILSKDKVLKIFEPTLRTFKYVLENDRHKISNAADCLRVEAIKNLNAWQKCLEHDIIKDNFAIPMVNWSFWYSEEPIFPIQGLLEQISVAKKELEKMDYFVSKDFNEEYAFPQKSFWLKAKRDIRGTRLY